MAFDIPEILAPRWDAPEGDLQPISDQVGDLVERFSSDANNAAVGALMRGLSFTDQALVHDRYTDAREWKVVSGALRQAFARSGEHTPDGTTLLHLIVDEVQNARKQAAEEDDDFQEDPVLRTLSKTHQQDRLWATVWDDERCAAASIVTVLSQIGVESLGRVAKEILSALSRTQHVLQRARTDLDSDDPAVRQLARRATLDFMTVFIAAANLRLPTLLESAGWTHSDAKSDESGIYLTPKSATEGFWVRTNTGLFHVRPSDANGKNSSISIQPSESVPKDVTFLIPPAEMRFAFSTPTVEFPDQTVPVSLLVAHRKGNSIQRRSKKIEIHLDPRPAAMSSVLGQITGLETQLVENAIANVGAELDRTETVMSELRNDVPQAETMQKLADVLLFASRKIYSGLSLLHATELLQHAGIGVELPSSHDAPSLQELARGSQPGDAHILVSDGHAAAYLHLTDGRRLVYDSEGIFGIRERDCLATYDPENAPRRTEALNRHYQEFFGLIRFKLR